MRKLKLAVAATIVAGLFVLVPNAVAGFLPQVQYSVGTFVNPQDAAISDLNGDGFQDMVSSNKAAETVSVLINDGDGTFATKVEYPAGVDPVAVTIGDVDGDGDPDLAVPNDNGTESGTVSILLNAGNGTFGSPVAFGTGINPTDVVIGQFQGNSSADLAVSNKGDDNFSVLVGNGNGTFQTKLDYTAGDNPAAIAAGDLNGDDRLDLAVALNGDSAAIFLYNPVSGYFTGPTTYVAAGTPTDLALADLNDDGDLDLAVSDAGGAVSTLFGNGDGTFVEPRTSYAVGGAPISVAVGDLTGDGIPDMATANNSGNNASVLTGNGDGTFQAAVNYPAGVAPWSVAIGDLDSDLNLDLAVAVRDDSAVSVLMNDAPEAVASPSSLTFPAQTIGTTEEQTVTVTNESGGGAMDVSSTSLISSGPSDFSIAENTCLDSSIPLAGTCELTVSFTPSAAGVRNADIWLNYNSAGSPLEIALTGTGADLTPPDTVINSGPSGTISTDSATFTFSGNPASDTAKIMCKLDAAAFADCTSPKTFSGLSNGPHTVSFRAQDAAGNVDPTPATRTFTVNEVNPPPVLTAKISKVTVKGPKKVKKGKKATFKVKITNSGSAAATGVKIKLNGKGVKANKSAGSVAAGKSKTVALKVKLKKPGKVKMTFKVTSSNAGTKTVKKKVTVKK